MNALIIPFLAIFTRLAIADPCGQVLYEPSCSGFSVPESAQYVDANSCYDSAPVPYAAPVYPEGQVYQPSNVEVVDQPNYLPIGRSFLELSVDCGPRPQPTPIQYLPPRFLKPVNEEIKVLPSPPLPAPVVISNKCSCTKVVQKPQLYQRVIVAQRNQRFLKKTYVPRTEKVEYCAKPRC